MNLRTKTMVGALCTTLTFACTEDSKPLDTADSGVEDSGVVEDSGAVGDVGLPDSGVEDVGITTDAGGGDGGLPRGTAAPRRGDMAFATDPRDGRTYMFFGDRAEPQMCDFPVSDFVDDGWVFDPSTGQWAEIVLSGNRPLKRARSAATWDERNNRVVLFGGRFRAGTTGDYTWLNDLWAFDPATGAWTELSAQDAPGGPSGRMNATVVPDPDRNRILVHGGGTTDFTAFQVDTDTWAFSFATGAWTQIATGRPQPNPPAESGRLFHVASIDRARGRMFVFAGGGQNAFNVFVGDMWYLNLVTEEWTQVNLGGGAPDARIKAAMIYDQAGDQLVLFGGHDNGNLGNDNDVWTFDLETLTWTRRMQGDRYNRAAFGFCDFPADFAIIDPASPERRESHLFSLHGNTAIMFGGRTDCGLANDTWFLDLTTMTWTQVSNSFTGMTCFRSGRTDCADPQARKCG
ncbi:MAG: hypothetical protein HY791_35710 [Deltaproteobacteria bacterium]|nr:hypothetical protein [Deltaproteobacteria bacterium]